MSTTRKILRFMMAAIAAIIFCLVLYAGSVFVSALIPVNTDFRQADDGFDIYVVSNGVHADILVPLNSPVIDWRQIFPDEDFGSYDRRANYLSFGWGDKAIFIDMPTWNDLTVRLALGALTGANGSAMHVEPRFIEHQPDILPDHIIRIRITKDQLAILTEHIKSGFIWNNDGKAEFIAKAIYTDHDAFYRATGSYSAFLTCNEWLRKGLAKSGIRMPFWAPFEPAIFYQLRKIKAG
ncbi:TIGR02117 family protein [Microvirga sp. W0021]|uniref:TIGR02117 family protein n=1 Tax=Hohaiivirga grylli TaxID=3133970 RepID=A0ABV0BGF0_9HYPH